MWRTQLEQRRIEQMLHSERRQFKDETAMINESQVRTGNKSRSVRLSQVAIAILVAATMAVSAVPAQASSAQMVKDINPTIIVSPGLEPRDICDVGGVAFFVNGSSVNGYGIELWKSDGTTAGTVLVKDINPGSSDSSPASLTNFNGTLYFRANDGVNGYELWKSDGTAAGTVLVKDINPGSSGGAGRPL
jgi:ELWxxDGT repeat protein